MNNREGKEGSQRKRNYAALLDEVVGNIPEDDYDGSPDQIMVITAEWFLKGACCEFAKALKTIFGYETADVVNKTDRRLLHRYCKTLSDGKTYYIDVRGVTSCEEEFMSKKANYFCMGERLETQITNDRDLREEYIHLAETFIISHKSYYSLMNK